MSFIISTLYNLQVFFILKKKTSKHSLFGRDPGHTKVFQIVKSSTYKIIHGLNFNFKSKQTRIKSGLASKNLKHCRTFNWLKEFLDKQVTKSIYPQLEQFLAQVVYPFLRFHGPSTHGLAMNPHL